MVYIGTSGYSYGDLVGPFYPQGMDKRDFQRFYTERLPAWDGLSVILPESTTPRRSL